MEIELIERIDAGVFADVWKGRDSLGREVAVKIIRFAGTGVSSALNHAKALASTNHRNVVSVYTIEKVKEPGSDEENDCVVMELINGPTLAQRLNGGRFRLEEVRSIGLQIIDGLEHIHSHGLAHGDLHVCNIMLEGICVKIIDILYIDTLAVLSTQRREDKLRRDLVSLRLVLQDILTHSELDPSEATAFNERLLTGADIEAVRQAFLYVTDPNVSSDAERLLDHAYRRATDANFVGGQEAGQGTGSGTGPLLLS